MDHAKHINKGINHMGMDHGGGGSGMEHGGMDMTCNMNMFINTDTNNLCIVFKQWRITGTWSLIQSLIVIVLLGMSFELMREVSRRYENAGRQIQLESPNTDSRSNSPDGRISSKRRRRRHLVKSLLYAFQVGISFMLMLVFMTYNVYVMLAVVVGSGLGYYFFNNDPNGLAGKTMACH